MTSDPESEYQAGAIIQAYFGARLNARSAYTPALRRFWEGVANWLDFAWEECDRNGNAHYHRTGKNPLTRQLEPQPELAARGEELNANAQTLYNRCLLPQLRSQLRTLVKSATALREACKLSDWTMNLAAKNSQPVSLLSHLSSDITVAEDLLSHGGPEDAIPDTSPH